MVHFAEKMFARLVVFKQEKWFIFNIIHKAFQFFTNILNIFIYPLSAAPLVITANNFYAEKRHGKTSEIKKTVRYLCPGVVSDRAY